MGEGAWVGPALVSVEAAGTGDDREPGVVVPVGADALFGGGEQESGRAGAAVCGG
nr:hypothetical protein [Nocardia abscessus]